MFSVAVSSVMLAHSPLSSSRCQRCAGGRHHERAVDPLPRALKCCLKQLAVLGVALAHQTRRLPYRRRNALKRSKGPIEGKCTNAARPTGQFSAPKSPPSIARTTCATELSSLSATAASSR